MDSRNTMYVVFGNCDFVSLEWCFSYIPGKFCRKLVFFQIGTGILCHSSFTVWDDYVDVSPQRITRHMCLSCIYTFNPIQSRDGEPRIRVLTDSPINIMDNHFELPMGRVDQLKPPKYYPAPVYRYTLQEMSLVWFMYGGHDFSDKKGIVYHIYR